MKYINFKGRKIAYTSEGKGITVVLLHGFCEDSSVWDEFKTDLLEESFRVICIDLPGFGASELLDKVSIEIQATLVQEVFQALTLDPFILIGHSMGGYISLAFAKRYPEKLLGLGLFHSHPYADTSEKKAARQKGINFIKSHGHVLFVKQLIPNLFAKSFVNSNAFLLEKMSYKAAAYSSKGIISALEAMKNRPDQSEVLKHINCPVLFIIGKKDIAVPEAFSIDQTHLPKVASIHILEKVGHMGMFEARKQCQLIVRQFAEFCVNKAKEA